MSNRTSRSRRAASDRAMSMNALQATVISQPLGSDGASSSHAESARISASCTASSAVAKSAPRRTRTLKTFGSELAELDVVHDHSVMVGGAVRKGRTSSHSWIGSPPAPGAADSSPASSIARS